MKKVLFSGLLLGTLALSFHTNTLADELPVTLFSSAKVTTTSNPTLSVEQQKVLTEAKKHLGKPYVWGGKGPYGFDCSGLVQHVYQNALKTTVASPTTNQERLGQAVSLSAIQPGDLLFYGSKGAAYHVGIYMGNNQMLHAPQPGQNVKITNIAYFYPQFAKRVITAKPTPSVNLANYYTSNPTKVATKKADTFYSSVEFSSSTKKNKINAGTVLTVQGIEYNKAGVPRLKTSQGYYTASKANVIKLTANIANYHTVNSGKFVTLKNDSFYSSTEFNSTTRKNSIKAGTILTIQGIEYNSAGVPRLKTSQGYYTAAKVNVVKAANNIANYYTANPGKVVTLKDDTFYSKVDFNKATQKNKIKAGTVLTVQKIEFNSAGIPRLKTAQGYYTAAKVNVKQK